MSDSVDAAFAEADAYDAAEAARLRNNEPAFTDGHFYFAQGDIEDVYYARATGRPARPITLTKCDPIEDDDAALEARAPLFEVADDGSVWLIEGDGGSGLVVWTCRDFLPFGRTQAQWLATLRATGSPFIADV
jgi:hypothetical protein